MSLNTPILSMDCKKKECLGNLYREGKCYCQGIVEVYGHDHLAEGKVIPHGIDDLQGNEGHISIGDSPETAEFIADNLGWWWANFGLHHYPDATTLLVVGHGGGASSYRHYAFKKPLLLLAQQWGIDIVICHPLCLQMEWQRPTLPANTDCFPICIMP